MAKNCGQRRVRDDELSHAERDVQRAALVSEGVDQAKRPRAGSW